MYFSMDQKLYVLLFKTTVQRAEWNAKSLIYQFMMITTKISTYGNSFSIEKDFGNKFGLVSVHDYWCWEAHYLEQISAF